MDDIKIKGLEGEFEFKKWLDANGLAYLYIDQSTDTFATLFKQSVKRPDFLVLLESIGMLAIDVKNYSLSGGVFTLGMTDEFQKALTFERIFRIPLWYAYKGDNCWYWISALKAIEVGSIRKNSNDNRDFLAIPLSEFEKISEGNEMGLLYTHRLPKVEEIGNVVASQPTPPSDQQTYEWEIYYDFSSSYTPNRVDKIISLWFKDLRFDIDYRRGEDSYLCTKEKKFDFDLIALIDYLNVQLMYDADSFCSPITVFGKGATSSRRFSIDHIIYAVSSVFYDDKSGSYYTIYIDDEKLTDAGKKVVAQNKGKSFLAQIGMEPDTTDEVSEDDIHGAGYALFAHIE